MAASGRDPMVIAGAIATAVWLVLILLFVFMGGDDTGSGGAQKLVATVGLVLPFLLIWAGVWLSRTLTALRDEADMLRDLLAQMRRQAGLPSGDVPPMPESRRDTGTRRIEAAPTARAPERAQPAHRTAAPAAEPAAPTAPQIPELSPTELVLALNFPDGPDDHEAIRSLRLALMDPDMSKLIRAAQDVVTLLAGRGAYMDDLVLSPVDPALWRRFAEGLRGEAVAGLTPITDEAALEVARNMMRDDEVFRDVAQHFLRHFDRVLSSAASEQSDNLLAAMAETRSGRAFTLLAQVSGMMGTQD